MNKQQFDKIFEAGIADQIKELSDNNSLITVNDLEQCKRKILNDYDDLRIQMKNTVFKNVYPQVMDRHRIAACMCGAMLRNEVFDISKMVEHMKKTGNSFEAGFQYANEVISLYSGCKVLSFFMMNDFKDNCDLREKIRDNFPIFPDTRQVKTEFMNVLCFNLHQIKDARQIGLKHYDPYAYAVIYFWLEEHFYHTLGIKSHKRQKKEDNQTF
ncbi:MAG: hypothetical protein K2J60_14735 [Acetatifactor sp.]|nr:hypothetical protein [Acetatifactor sp.]